MFNEAFWFFYWVGVIDSLNFSIVVILLIAAALTVASFPIYYIDNVKGAKKWHTLGPIICLALFLTATFLPSKDALYAGAGQYVAEAGEVDQTLLNLKDLLDQKIAELSVKEDE